MSRLALAVALLAAPAARADDPAAKVNPLFARWDKPDTPGCAVAVVRDGRVVFERGYGLADLEHGVRIGPDTVFHAASVSKQFTAFAVLLMERDGKLSLDDEVRKHLPDFPDFDKRVTVALDDFSFSVETTPPRVTAIVGESGRATMCPLGPAGSIQRFGTAARGE